jgi:hypothetical protein|tara:strand:+ start:711 stop:1127 length:417 start_codon:yes stop_codon:yes gene_type:complete
MPYNALVVDKSENEFAGYSISYTTHMQSVRDTAIHLHRLGHRARIVTALCDMTEAAYTDSDLVLAHVMGEKARRIRAYHKKHPHVGLIMTSGDIFPGETDISRMWDDGIYFLERPATDEQLEVAIRETMQFARPEANK